MSQLSTNTTPTRSRSLGDRILRIAAVTALIGAIAILVLSNTSAARALTLATTKQTEPFTELYFNNHQNLPAQVTANQAASFSYHVTNQEAMATTYQARILLAENGRIRVLQEDSFVLAKGAGKDITVRFTTPYPNTQLKLIIQLKDRKESIHFRSQS